MRRPFIQSSRSRVSQDLSRRYYPLKARALLPRGYIIMAAVGCQNMSKIFWNRLVHRQRKPHMYACRRSALQRILRPSTRTLATSVSASPLAPSSALNVFDAGSKLAQRNRAAADPEQSRLTDYVRDELAAVMVDRLLVLACPICHLFVGV